MRRTRALLLFVLPVLLFGCNRASWGPDSGWETYNDPDSPDLEIQDNDQTQGSYTPLHASEAEDADDED
ncbi:MAG: hypothetical protein AB8H86_11735 [Polyangiales bacterium]